MSREQPFNGSDPNAQKQRGIYDPTAGKAVASADRPPRQVREVVHILRLIASLAGFEIVGKIILRDKATGREW